MEISDLRIYSISGSEVLNFNFERINPKHIIINVADFKPGIYLVLVNLVGGDSMNYKIAVIK